MTQDTEGPYFVNKMELLILNMAVHREVTDYIIANITEFFQ
jgi:hypothetical protein